MASNLNEKFWAVRDVSERTRRNVKVVAAQLEVTMGQAVELLVDAGLLDSYTDISRTNSTGYYPRISQRLALAASYYSAVENRAVSNTEAARLLSMVAQIQEQVYDLSDRALLYTPIDTFGLDLAELDKFHLLSGRVMGKIERAAEKRAEIEAEYGDH